MGSNLTGSTKCKLIGYMKKIKKLLTCLGWVEEKSEVMTAEDREERERQEKLDRNYERYLKEYEEKLVKFQEFEETPLQYPLGLKVFDKMIIDSKKRVSSFPKPERLKFTILPGMFYWWEEYTLVDVNTGQRKSYTGSEVTQMLEDEQKIGKFLTQE